MKLTPCLSGHLYIEKDGRKIHISPQDIRDLHNFLHRENMVKDRDHK